VPHGTPFSLSFFLLALLHFCVYSLLVCESPAQSFLVREQANFEGFSVLTVHAQAQLLIEQALTLAAQLYTQLAQQQRTVEAAAQQAHRADQPDSVTQPPSLTVSATHFLGLRAFLPSGSSDKAAAAAAHAENFAAALVAA